MSDAPKRRLIDQLGVSPTFVAEGCRFTGDVETTGPLVVCGAIRGDGKVGGPLSMAAKAHWEGEIHAQAAVVAGRISGKLVIEHKLEVGATAVIRADIVAGSIAVAKGAVIVGEVTVAVPQQLQDIEFGDHPPIDWGAYRAQIVWPQVTPWKVGPPVAPPVRAALPQSQERSPVITTPMGGDF